MALTRKEYTGNGSTTLYNIDFDLGYIDRDYIYVYIEGNEPENQLSYTWQNSNQIELNEPVTSGTKFYIRRIITRDNLVNDYTNGALLRASNLNDSYLQTLMILQEIQDGFITVDDEFLVQAKFIIVQNLDMAGYKIENLQEADVGTDATTLTQVKNLINLASNLDGYAAQLVDYLKLEIFQSPTDGLTRIKTRTLSGGEIYEVRKVSDDSLATIYSDVEGTEIVQDGTNNISDSDGVVRFYTIDGDYYMEVNSQRKNFTVKTTYASSFGFVEGSDNTSQLTKMLLHKGSLVLDIVGNYPAESITILNNNIAIVGGEGCTFTFSGLADSEFFIKIQTDSADATIDLGVASFDADNKAAKAVYIENSVTGKHLQLDIKTYNARQTASTGLAAGAFLNGGFYQVKSEGFLAENITSLGGSLVSSGLRTSQSGSAVSTFIEINNPTFKNISPSDDGDGVVLAQSYPFTVEGEYTINNPKFYNCDKRAVKTQCYKTVVNNPVIERDRTTSVSAGKIEIDAQYGNATINNPSITYSEGGNAPTALFSLNAQRGVENGSSTVVNGGYCTVLDDTVEVTHIALASTFDSNDRIKNAAVTSFNFFGKVGTPLAIRPLASTTFNDVVVEQVVMELFIKNVTGTHFCTIDRSGTGYAYVDGLTIKNCVVGNKQIELSDSVTTNVGLNSYYISASENIEDPAGSNNLYFNESGTVNSAQSFSVNSGLNSSLSYSIMYSTNAGTNEMMARTGTVLLGASNGQFLDVTSSSRDAAAGGGTLTVSANLVGSEWDVSFNKSAGVAISSGSLSLVVLSGDGVF